VAARLPRAGRPRATSPGDTPGSQLRLVIPSQTALLGLVRDIAQRIALLNGFDESTAQRVALAVDEATTNSIEHAYGGEDDCEIEIRFREVGPDLRVEILDAGRTVDPQTIPRVDLERYVSERRTGGLGVHLMARIMDSVSFRRAGGRNVCCLVKRRPGVPER
jgi:serine/threonine-protein kinase RsbW